MTTGAGGTGGASAKRRAWLLVGLLAIAPALGLAWPQVAPRLAALTGHGPSGSPEGTPGAAPADAGWLPLEDLQALSRGGGFAEAMPSDVGALLRLAGAADDLPLPQAEGPDPLHRAIAQHYLLLGQPVPASLADQLAGLRLGPEGERAVAQLVAAYDEARRLQSEALLALTGDEIRLLALHPGAVQAWYAAHPGAEPADLEDALAALAARVDTGKSLQAASLLARAVEAARPALAPAAAGSPLADRLAADPWLALRQQVEASFGVHQVPAPGLPALPLPDALRLLAVAAGQPDPLTVEVPPLPPGLADALARLAVAQAYALLTQDPLLGGLAILDAAEAAQDAVGAYAGWLALSSSHLPLPAGHDELAMVEEAIASLGLPVPEAPEVPEVDPTLPVPEDPTNVAGLLADLDDDGTPDSVEVLLGTDAADPASRPANAGGVGSLPPPAAGAPLLLIGRVGAPPTEPALLSIGSIDAENVTRPALLRVDLGGDDTYEVAVGTPTALLLEAGGHDRYDTPATDGTQGATDGLGAGLLLDLAGNDTYLAGRRSHGSACCGRDSAPGPLDGRETTEPVLAIWGDLDTAFQGVRRQAGGLGLLADLGGNDTYRSGRQSQGYGNNLALSAAHHALAADDPARGFAGILFDAHGDDRYRFATQGFAEVGGLEDLEFAQGTPIMQGQPVPASGEGGRPVGLFVDGNGTDTYENLQEPEPGLMPLNPEDLTARRFASQGNARVRDGAPRPGPSPVGVFLDLEGHDRYTGRAVNGAPVDASDGEGGKNGRLITVDAPVAGTDDDGDAFAEAPARVFWDVDPESLEVGALDDDGDGAPSVVETLAGTDPDDGEDSAGSLFGDRDPEGTLLRAPHLLAEPLDGTLVLPGLAIGGFGHDVYDETFDFFLDLGGNDTYLAPGHGGAALPNGTAPGQPPPAVRLALDAGGDDLYLPATVRVEASGPSDNLPITAYGTAPSLGGAHLGVALLADLGGNNTFRAALNVSATHEFQAGAGQKESAFASGWTASQGAGVFGGVGVLLTYGSRNTFEADVAVRAEDTDPDQAQGIAVAYAAGQGAGFLGIGILANLDPDGAARDVYRLGADALATNSVASQAREVGLGQGAGMGGVGVLVDAGGDNDFAAPEGVAQGTGWGFANRTGATPSIAFGAEGRPLEDGNPVRASTTGGAGVGVLVSGAGNDTFLATGPAQGAGGGYQSLETLYDGRFVPDSDGPALRPLAYFRGGSGAGVLLDQGGHDAYTVPGASPTMVQAYGSPTPLVAQGAALAASFGMLADLAGDDRYVSGPGFWSQAAATAGVALLADLEGQDEYLAHDAAQGYAQAAGVASTRTYYCGMMFSPAHVPCNLRTFAVQQPAPAFLDDSRGMELLLETLPQGMTMALLFDADGVDVYRAGQEAQGFATDAADASFRYAFCRGRLEPVPQVGQPTLSPCPMPPGTQEGKNITLPGSPKNPDFIPMRPLGPAVRGPLIGALVDSDGSDTYRYDDDADGDAVRKVAFDPFADPAPTGPNDWAWRQEVLAPRTVNDTNLPGNPYSGAPTPVSSGMPPQNVLNLLWDAALKSYPEIPAGLGGQEAPPPPAFGGGVDAFTVNRAARELAAAGAPVATVTLDATRVDGSDLPQGSATGTVLLTVTVEDTPPGVEVARVDVVSDRGAVGRAEPAPGGEYRLLWATDARDAGVPRFADGPYGLRAAAVLRAAPGAAGRSVESNLFAVQVDNPPVLVLEADRAAFSGRSSPPAEPLTLHLVVGPDRDRAGQPAGTTPGGHLSIAATPLDGPGQGPVTLLAPTVKDAGPLDVAWTGRCGNAPCPDGRYRIDAVLTDFGGQSTAAQATVRLDSTAPVSRVSLPASIGESLRQGLDGIQVPWTVSDGAPGLDGVTIDIVRLGAGGVHTLVGDGDLPATQPSAIATPVADGETVRFVAMARDALGNLEGGCEANDRSLVVASCVDAFVAANPGRVAEARIDFNAPRLLDVTLSRGHVRPGDPIAVYANVTEAGLGLSHVRADFSGDDGAHALGRLTAADASPERWAYAGWGDVNPGIAELVGNETEVTVTVTAVDRALNDDDFEAKLVVDDRAPRLAPAGTGYFAPGGFDESNRLLVGRPGAFAVLRLDVEDPSLEPGLPGVLVQADLSGLNASLGLRNMTFDPASLAWGLQVRIPDDTADDAYAIPLVARDAAGNVNQTVATLLSSNEPIPLSALTEVAVGHDSVTLAWQSERPGTTQVRYGRSTLNLPQATPVVSDLATMHAVTVTGLAPNTPYFFQGVSRGGNGIDNRTPILGVRTTSAIQVGFSGIEEGSTQGGFAAVHVGVRLLTGEEAPVGVTIAARSENASLGSIPLVDLPPAVGDRDLRLDLRTVPDGAWHLVVEAFRPGDRATLVTPLFRIDHSEPFIVPLQPHPGAVVNQARPGILLAIGDPGGDLAHNWSATAALRIGKDAIPVRTAPGGGVEAPEGTTLLLLEPLADLPEGEVRLEASLRDGAGNAARALWPFTVDTAPPTLVSAKAVGPAGHPAAPPGGRVRVEVTATDATGVAGGFVDLSPFGRPPAALARTGAAWTAELTVPQGARDGERELNVTLSDRAGNLRRAGAATLTVDGAPPELVAAEPRAGQVAIDLGVHASEPVVASIALPDGDVATAGSAEALLYALQLHLPGLLPGTDYTFALTLADAAGLNRTVQVSASTLPDGEAPTAPMSLSARSEAEGLVDLAWLPATDDSGVLRYEYAAGDGENWTAVPDEDGLATQVPAPPGATLLLRVRAVDLVGKAGDAASATVEVLALPHLADARARTDVAEAGESVTFEVIYSHPTGRLANVTLLLGERAIPMRHAAGDCSTGCLMVAEAVLQATDLFDGPPTFTVVAHDGVHEARTEPQRAPFAVAGDAEAPAVALPLAALLLALSAFVRRRKP